MSIDNKRGELINIARRFAVGEDFVISRDDIPEMIDSMIKAVKENDFIDDVSKRTCNIYKSISGLGLGYMLADLIRYVC